MNRVLFAIHSLQVGGMERVCSELANIYCEKNEFEVHIVLYGIKRNVFYNLNPSIIIHKPNFEFDNNKRNWSTLKTLFFLRKIVKNIQPITILSFGEYWNNLVLLSTLRLKVPVYIADRSTPMKNLGTVQNRLRKYLYPTAKGLIVQTEKAKEIYKKSFKNLPIKVVGNPITQFDNQKDVQRENIILSVGRLIETKHHDKLIRIFEKTKAIGWKLVIVGGNAKKQQTKESLEELIKSLNVIDSVVLAGNQKDMASYYLKSKIFAFTSSSEGFPNVLGEAMTAGLPVIAYDCMAGPSEIITDNEDGFLIPLFDDVLFQEKLDFLMQHEEIRNKMGSKAIQNIKRYDADSIAQQFLKVILP